MLSKIINSVDLFSSLIVVSESDCWIDFIVAVRVCGAWETRVMIRIPRRVRRRLSFKSFILL